ncbi:TonB-dependent receptor [Rubrivirga litoralis]|uniref:Carboxypeptidase regulatory-like domain-containing protein n=1 Tax=Rubrivirga litoralis TaxID=3075598 RepID=A0ABU3BNX0_9BACT|nr:carboxypeptidase regulatory-like domain-containing protein [Rubrivirga sp. F394]MDT0630990.1 carboxypeptidase regulatory-like domain-containing protein [Rubrivirga sp. F394]
MRNLLLALLVLAPAAAMAQGTTTSTLTGTVTDVAGVPIPGANVVAVHEPSGTPYGAATQADGRYSIRGLRVGGPYTVTARFVGYGATSVTGLQLTLGQTETVDFELAEDTAQLGEVSVIAIDDPILSGSRTGARTTVDEEQIERLPTINRSLADFARLTPQAATGTDDQVSVAGRNNRYNNIQVDGATLNDVFGLSGTGAPGGQANAQPISLDAVETFNVDIAPFDVRYNGFTGAQINAVTKSGTNNFSGSVRYLGRNEALVGSLPSTDAIGETDEFGDFSNQFFVGTLGGPIIQDKLFFFANAEVQTITTPLDAGVLGSSSSNIFPIAADSLQRIIDIAQNQYGYDPGTFDAFSADTDNLKLLGKLDWNVSDANRASFRVNYVDATDEAGVGRGRRSFDLSNRQYNFASKTLSSVAELRSNFGADAYNEARLVYTRIRDSRDVQSNPFPQVEIDVTSPSGDPDQPDRGTVNLGIDRFSQANALDQDILEFTDNLTLTRGAHTVTLGTSNQYYRFSNLFIQDYYGAYEFDSINDFAAGDPARFNLSYSLLDDEQPRAAFSALQFGLYAQDEYQVSPTLALTGGLRVDLPVFLDTPLDNPASVDAFGLSTTDVPNGQVLFSPRVGFNYAVDETRSTQVRGGTGIFSGRAPFVWVSNVYSNTGVDFARVDTRDAGFFVPSADPSAQQGAAQNLPIGDTSEINLLADGFKFPQVWRSNLAFDQRLPGDVVATLEGLYTKNINDVAFRNLNLEQTGTAFDGRPVFGTAEFDGFTPGRPIRGRTSLVDDRFTNAILLENTSEGYEYFLTAALRKRSEGLDAGLSYTYGRATNVNNGSSSRAISNFQYNESFNPNAQEVGTADFEVRHRVLGNLAYRAAYADRFATTIGLVYDGRSGEPFSWIYDGNANADTRDDNDLAYIPASPSDIVLVTNNYDALDAFIEGEPSLADNRGTVAERNSARSSWRNILDLQLTQEIETVRGQKVELTANLLNVLNLFNSEWGHVLFPAFNNYRFLDFFGYVDQDDIGTEVNGVTITEADLGKPVVAFNELEDENADGEIDRDDLFSRSNIASRWQLQLGVRYTF